MSAYLLHWDHIGYLVNLGLRLDIRRVFDGVSYRSLFLGDPIDRETVTYELMLHNRLSLSYRYQSELIDQDPVPHFVQHVPPLLELQQIAQAIQWVRCYRYQSCEHPSWQDSFAYHYSQALLRELESLVLAQFETSWDYNGPHLATKRAA